MENSTHPALPIYSDENNTEDTDSGYSAEAIAISCLFVVVAALAILAAFVWVLIERKRNRVRNNRSWPRSLEAVTAQQAVELCDESFLGKSRFVYEMGIDTEIAELPG